jgi:hypothetical protein
MFVNVLYLCVCVCLCVCTLCVHVYICSPLQLSDHITLTHETVMTLWGSSTILLQFHVINIVNMTTVWIYGIWGTWVPFKSQSLKCCALTNLRKYATVNTVSFNSRTKKKNILSDWQETRNSPEPVRFLLLNTFRPRGVHILCDLSRHQSGRNISTPRFS